PSPRQHRIEEMRAAADDQIRPRLFAAFEEFRNLMGKMLAVRVKCDDGVVSILYGVRERTLERCSFSAVLRMAKEASSSGRRNRAEATALVSSREPSSTRSTSSICCFDARTTSATVGAALNAGIATSTCSLTPAPATKRR